MTKIKDITKYLEQIAPIAYQESYDNSGLIVGDPEWEVKGVLVSLDCIEAVIEEAIEHNCNLVVAHHPILFKALKQLNGKNYVERTLIKAIKHDVAIYAIHTNLDHVQHGVNDKFAQRLGLTDLSILSPKPSTLCKLVTFVPAEHLDVVATALHEAGAGTIGDYDSCGFSVTGTGTFRPKPGAEPFIGSVGELEQVSETRLEVVVPRPLSAAVIGALNNAHPYEEVAYYLQDLNNMDQTVGAGMIGTLSQPHTPTEFLQLLKDKFGTPCIKHTVSKHQNVQKIAICGGAGSFLIQQAKAAGCQAYVTSDLKYHEYFDAEDDLLLADIGHYESEVATKELLSDILTKNFSTFAVRLSQMQTNPVRYF